MSINGHKTGVQEANVKKEKKSTCKSHYIPQKIYTLPLTKMSYTNSPPKYKTTLIQDYSHPKLLPFLS